MSDGRCNVCGRTCAGELCDEHDDMLAVSREHEFDRKLLPKLRLPSRASVDDVCAAVDRVYQLGVEDERYGLHPPQTGGDLILRAFYREKRRKVLEALDEVMNDGAVVILHLGLDGKARIFGQVNQALDDPRLWFSLTPEQARLLMEALQEAAGGVGQ